MANAPFHKKDARCLAPPGEGRTVVCNRLRACVSFTHLPEEATCPDCRDWIVKAAAVFTRGHRRRVGFDPATGMPLESIRWALYAVHSARPKGDAAVMEGIGHWVNSMAALAAAFLRASGSRDELVRFEGDGFSWGPPTASEGGAANA